jgi:hypothetical protein
LPPLVCMRFPEYASFSVLRETPMPFSRHYFKKLKCYRLYWSAEGPVGYESDFVEIRARLRLSEEAVGC